LACLLEVLYNLIELRTPAPQDRNPSRFSDEGHGDGTANAASPSGYDGNFAFEACHVLPNPCV
jgi:hypothetical protein